MKKYWGSCLLGVLLCLFLIMSMSDDFWVGLNRGFFHALLIVVIYLIGIIGVVTVLGAGFWGYNRIAGVPQPLVYYLWMGSLVSVAFCIAVWFLDKLFKVV